MPITPRSYETFLSALSSYGNVTQAAEQAGISRSSLYKKRRDDPTFAEAWAEAEALGAAALEDEARRRAVEGWVEPVWSRGEQCGEVRKYSDRLLVTLLKAHMPEKYQERRQVEHSGNAIAPLSPKEAMAALLARLEEG